METIHFKTVDPVGQELLRAAAHKGFELVWERFEAQQPQDGFLRTGLTCPFGCMQGPCRIDPFGRGAKQGICGLGRDEMVAASLLRLALNGALESGATEGVEPDAAVGKAAVALGGPVSVADIAVASRMLCRPAVAAGALLRQALRLGLLTLGTGGGGAEGATAYRIGYGLLAGNAPVIGVYGNVPAGLLTEVTAEADKAGVTVVSLGSWADAGAEVLPSVCTSVEVEPLIASGRVHLVLAGPATAAGIGGVAAAAGVPVVAWNEGAAAAEIVANAKRQAGSAVASGIAFTPAMVAEATALRGDAAVAKELNGKGVALIGGFDSPHQSVGWIPSEVAPSLKADGLTVSGWGDAAAWMIKAGHGDSILDLRSGLLAALKAVGAKGLKGVCFVSLGGVRDVALSLGLAACGVPVCSAAPLPVWGSKVAMAELDSQLQALGGALKHFDKPATADEILAWFRSV